MKVNKIIITLLAVISLASTFAFISADDDPIKKIVAQLSKWTDDNPQEKVYLHMDKPFYAAGEDIWFKAYVTIGEKHQLSALSAILNVELLDDKDSIKHWIKLPVINGTAWGDFALADTIKPGNYRIRAYTNYMRNAGEDYFFDKSFVIGNSINNSVFTKVTYNYSTINGKPNVSAAIVYTDINGTPYANKEVSYDVQWNAKSIARGKGVTDGSGLLTINFTNTTAMPVASGRIMTDIKYADKKNSQQTLIVKSLSGKIDVQFFPEGGSLVNGLRSKIAFKATGADGLGVDIKGIIKDNANNDVARLTASHFGMGYVVFAPESGKTYKAVITNPDGTENTFALPAAADKGYTLSVNSNDPANILLKVGASNDIVGQGNAQISIMAQQNGHVYYAANTKITQASFGAIIPKNRFPTGIVQFTLFSQTGEPLNERIVFIQNPDLLKLNISSEKQTYLPREKVKLNISSKDAGDKPVTGSFSAVVIDETKVPADEASETTILSSLLLTSDLKGYIEKPNYYFTNPNEQTQAQLDALMLTQGYRRFVWKQILSGAAATALYQPEKSLAISGTIKTSGGKPVPKAKITLFATAGGTFILDTIADDQGRFAFNNMIFKDSIKFVVQARTAKNSKFVEITLDNIGHIKASRNKNTPDFETGYGNTLINYLQNSKSQYNDQVKFGVGNHVTMLKEVVITEKKKPLENSSNLNGPGNANQVIKSDQLSTCPTLEQCLVSRAAFVQFRNGLAYSTRSPNRPMQIVLDGMQMGDDFTLDNITPADVESVEVLRSAEYTSIYGSRGGAGVLVITTKRGGSDDSFTRYAPGIVTYAPKGYYVSREFYAPKYDDPKTNAAIPDLRTTVYWKPDIITGKDGQSSIEFFNADSKGIYRVVIEGIDNDGNLGRQIYRYKVE